MDLLLKVVDGPADRAWQGLEARFDPSGGLIGRAETARLSLPDSTRTVSRFHVHVSCSGDTFYLEEMGSRNAATINGKALKAGSKEALRPGDQVRVGHFTLSVEFDDPEFPATQVIDPRELRMRMSGNEDDQATQVAVRVAGRAPPSYSPAGLLEALQDGAGVEVELPAGLQPEFIRALGQILRTLVSGVHRLSSQRMRLREEPSPEKARPQSRHVDPIRAAAEESRMLGALLKPTVIGSGKSLHRAQEMIDDLAARLAAMRTGVTEALQQAEARLSPAAVEERLDSSLFLDELFPMRRKARLWDLYRRTHRALKAERPADAGDAAVDAAADGKGGAKTDGFRELFNNAYTRAYEAEIARLRRERR